MSGNKKLAEARILAAKQAPYLRAGLMSLIPVERPRLNTCAMDAHGRLYYDPAFLEARELKHNAFVVVHEFIHYHQRHAQRQKAVVQRDPAKLEVWRGTVEGPTNEIAESCFGWCPEEATTSEKLGLPRNLTVEEAFARKWKERCEEKERREEERKRQEEAEKQRQNHEAGDDSDQGESPSDDSGEDGGGDPGPDDDLAGLSEGEDSDDGTADGAEDHGDSQDQGEGNPESEVADESQPRQCESQGQQAGENGQGQASGEDAAGAGDGAAGNDGNGGPGQGGQGEGAETNSQGTLSTEEISQRAQDIGGSACDGIQRPWEFGPPNEENPGLSESDQDVIEAAVAKAIEQHVASHGKGSVPAPLAKQASELLHKPVDPCRELAAMTKYAVDTIAGFGEFTYARPSNRQIPGGCLLPSSVKPIPRITLIIDSSGSMGSDDTAMALEVLGSVLKHLPDPRGLRVLVGGTRVEAARRVFKPEQIAVLDGGGTDMGVLIRLADQERSAPKVIMCVTDGETPWCAERDVSAKVMVCLTRKPRLCSSPPAWMRTVCLNPADE